MGESQTPQFILKLSILPIACGLYDDINILGRPHVLKVSIRHEQSTDRTADEYHLGPVRTEGSRSSRNKLDVMLVPSQPTSSVACESRPLRTFFPELSPRESHPSKPESHKNCCPVRQPSARLSVGARWRIRTAHHPDMAIPEVARLRALGHGGRTLQPLTSQVWQSSSSAQQSESCWMRALSSSPNSASSSLVTIFCECIAAS